MWCFMQIGVVDLAISMALSRYPRGRCHSSSIETINARTDVCVCVLPAPDSNSSDLYFHCVSPDGVNSFGPLSFLGRALSPPLVDKGTAYSQSDIGRSNDICGDGLTVAGVAGWLVGYLP